MNIIEPELIELSKLIIKEAKIKNIVIKLLGGVAIWKLCPLNHDLYNILGRKINDIDFASESKYKSKLDKMLVNDFNLILDPIFESIPGVLRSAFYDKKGKKICDINYDSLMYSHKIELKSSFKNDLETISLTDLLLSKFQIKEINNKDIIDIFLLLIDYEIGYNDSKKFDINYIAKICKNNWGFEHTIRKNFHQIYNYLNYNNTILEKDRKIVIKKLFIIVESIQKSNKSLRWFIRKHFHEYFKWYNVVESI